MFVNYVHTENTKHMKFVALFHECFSRYQETFDEY